MINVLRFKTVKFILASLIMMIMMNFNLGYAQPNPKMYIDVYGTDKITSDILKNRFGNEIQSIYNLMISSDIEPAGDNLKKIEVLTKKIKDNTKKLGDFVYYKGGINKAPYAKDVYFTIDIIERKDAQRLANFLPNPVNSLSDPDNLLVIWDGYLQTAFMNAIANRNIRSDNITCPFYYCMFGFKATELKKYEPIFSVLVPKNKDKLISILREDKDPKKRAAAASLLGHIKDGEELIKFLIPAMHDSDSGVRSTVMGVLASTLYKLKTADFPIQTAIDALDYPALEDRKQALVLVAVLAKQHRYAKYLKEHARNQLMTQLKMNMPASHDEAYETLTGMSGCNFGDRDYTAWQNWLYTTKSS
jgi:hypothetical protein